jgi:hypothetical protein
MPAPGGARNGASQQLSSAKVIRQQTIHFEEVGETAIEHIALGGLTAAGNWNDDATLEQTTHLKMLRSALFLRLKTSPCPARRPAIR